MGILDFIFGQKLDEFFRENCPSCWRKGLEGHADKCLSRGFEQGRLVNPTYTWFQCIYCGARFRKDNAPEGTLVSVSEKEWVENVEACDRPPSASVPHRSEDD